MAATATATGATLELVTRFESNLTPLDVDAVMADMSDDVVFEHFAAEDACLGRHVGQAAVRAVWSSLEEHFPDFRFELLDVFAAGDRAACRWKMT